MDLFAALETTRSIRRFTDEPVTDEEILICLRAATQGPSGGNIQPWQFVAVTDAEVKRALGDVYRRAYDRYEPALLKISTIFRSPMEEQSFDRMRKASRHLADHLGEAPALVLVCMPNISMTLSDEQGELDVGTPFASIYPAVQNFMLACRGEGLGTALTTLLCLVEPQVKELLAIPEGFATACHIAVGYPKYPFPAELKRRPVDEIAFGERFGSRLV